MSGINRPNTPKSVTSRTSTVSSSRPGSAASGRSRDVQKYAIYTTNGPISINATKFLEEVIRLDSMLRGIEGKLRYAIQNKFKTLSFSEGVKQDATKEIKDVGEMYDLLFDQFNILKDTLGVTEQTGLKKELSNMKGAKERIKSTEHDVGALGAALKTAEVFFEGKYDEADNMTKAGFLCRVSNINTMDTLLKIDVSKIDVSKKTEFNERLGDLKCEERFVEQIRKAMNPEQKAVTFSFDPSQADQRSAAHVTNQKKEPIVAPAVNVTDGAGTSHRR